MESFAADIDDDELKGRLFEIIEVGEGVEDFEKVLFEHPSIEEKWSDFRDKSIRSELTEWLCSIGIEPIMDKK